MKLHTKYQRPGPSGFRQEDFKGFCFISLCKTYGPRDRVIFCPEGYNLNNLGRSPLDEAVLKISNASAFLFQTRRFLKVFPI